MPILQALAPVGTLAIAHLTQWAVPTTYKALGAVLVERLPKTSAERCPFRAPKQGAAIFKPEWRLVLESFVIPETRSRQ